MKTKFNPISSFMFLLLISFVLPGFAQRRPTTKSRTNKIKIFKVKPGEVNSTASRSLMGDLDKSSRVASRLSASSKNLRVAPKASTAMKKVWIKGHGTLPPPPPHMENVAPKPESQLTYINLSAKDPFKGVLGHLEFNEVRHMDSKENYVVWYNPNPGMGYMKAFVKLEKGSKYLVDFSIACSESREFHLGTTGGGQKTNFNKGSHHLVTIIEATSSGTSQMMLWADKDWTFHSLEITKLE